MKPIFLALALFILIAAPLRAELTIISAEHRDADSFKRVSEYLTGKPSDGRYAVFRSEASDRNGFYVSLLASDKNSLKGVTNVQLQYVPPGTQEVTTVNLPADNIDKKRLLVGLTGSPWSDPKTIPVAWKISLLDSSGNTIETAQSFLWAVPST